MRLGCGEIFLRYNVKTKMQDNKIALTLSDLPPPPPSKSGWPWTEQTEPLPEWMPDGSEWPRISIVTPSYNQGEFIEETIRSVLLQGYPNLEYIIIDGGSTDNSVAIIEKYEKYLTYWVSEKDRGQSHAINKGLKRISGDIWAYLNSDDRYLNGTFKRVAQEFHKNPQTLWITGHARYLDADGSPVKLMIPTPVNHKKDALIRWEGPKHPICIEPANFMRRVVIEKYGFYEEFLNYCMDFEFNIRLFFDDIIPTIVPEVLAEAYLHGNSKTVSKGNQGAFRQEDLIIIERWLSRLSNDDYRYVKQKVSELKFWFRLMDVDKIIKNKGRLEAMQGMMSMLMRHPLDLSHRATLGMLLRITR